MLTGSGRWDHFEQTLTDFPPARPRRLTLWATRWSEAGERTGLTWFDDVSAGARARTGGAAATSSRRNSATPAPRTGNSRSASTSPPGTGPWPRPSTSAT
ncbi:MAG: hypothetical protein U1F77_07995 [Kiritimatiellia bacterium]